LDWHCARLFGTTQTPAVFLLVREHLYFVIPSELLATPQLYAKAGRNLLIEA
jgi:hypothetical protein